MIKPMTQIAGAVALLGAAVLAPAGAQAHDIWMTARADGPATVAEVSFGDLAGPVLADPARIVTLELLGAGAPRDLRQGLTEGQNAGHPVWATAAFHAPVDGVLTVSYDNGFWLKRPGDRKETNASKLMAPDGQAAHMTVKYGKLLLGPGAYAKSAEARLELIPLKDPFALPAGSPLPVRLELDGKPFAGAEIAYTDGLARLEDAMRPTMKTGADGVAQIPLSRRGPYLLTTDIDAAPAHPALADNDHIFASLSFDTSAR